MNFREVIVVVPGCTLLVGKISGKWETYWVEGVLDGVIWWTLRHCIEPYAGD